MSIFFGGLGLVSLRRPFSEWSNMLLGKGEIKSVLCALVSFLVILVLAYLTNPSEISFRTYLTEQSFRQHLSRLDDDAEDDNTDSDDVKVHYSLTSRRSVASCDNSTAPFHFANRASVSLRTPKHVFHSFGIFTIAAVIPIAKYRSSVDDCNGASMVTDSWFIGAFGKWWRGGVIEAWYHDVVARNKDEEGWSSGILGIKALDKRNNFQGLPFSTTAAAPRLLTRGSPPKLRNRERSSPPRSLTPPPLPKSASLPLHAPPNSDHRHSRLDKTSNGHHTAIQPTIPTVSEQARLSPQIHSHTPSGLFDQSPLIVEVLRQISLTKTVVLDLRTQLADFETAASEAHTSLQSEAEGCRERKRQEDATKLELKTRTKTLEDSKRAAEGNKREAEKRLKVAQSARENASQRRIHLDNEIGKLQRRLLDDADTAQQAKDDMANEETEIRKALEHKRHEIKVAEDVIAALNTRARELEDKIANEKERLRLAQQKAEARRQEQSIHPMHVVSDSNAWSPYAPYDAYNADYVEHSESLLDNNDDLPGFTQQNKSPKSQKLSLTNFKGTETSHTSLRAKGYSIFDEDLASLAQPQPPRFAPFSDVDSPRGPSSSTVLIPTGLIQSLDGKSSENLSRSFQSDNDPIVEPEWRTLRMPSYPQLIDAPVSLTASPTSLTGPSFNDYDPAFEVHQTTSEPYFVDHLHRMMPSRTHSDPVARDHGYGDIGNATNSPEQNIPRRWFSALHKESPKKGLNPGAKVFHLPSRSGSATNSANSSFDTSYDALNPTGLGSSIVTPSTSSSLLRAFAPSPAEREVLQRALGGSTNTSLERLPSLSDVGSIPSSPSHVHAVSAHPRQIGLPSWLQSFPRIKKPNFSPWDDEEDVRA